MKRGFVWTPKDEERAIAEKRKSNPDFVPDEKSLISPQSLCPHCGKHRYEHFDYVSGNPYEGKYQPCQEEREYYLRKYFTIEMNSCIFQRPDETELSKLFSVYEFGHLKKGKIKNAFIVAEYALFLSHLQAFTEFLVFKNKVRKFNIQFIDVLMLRSKKFDEKSGRSDFGMFDDKHLLVFDLSKKGYSNIADESHVEELILHRKSKSLPIWFWNPTRWVTNPNVGDKNIKEIGSDNFVTITIGDVSCIVPAEDKQDEPNLDKQKPARNAKQVGGKQLRSGART